MHSTAYSSASKRLALRTASLMALSWCKISVQGRSSSTIFWTPRVWPSMRLSRLIMSALISCAILITFPLSREDTRSSNGPGVVAGYRDGSPQPDGAQAAAEENDDASPPSALTDETSFSTCSLPQRGQTVAGGLLIERTKTSKGSLHSSQWYS